MFRALSFTLILAVVWQIIGFGFYFVPAEVKIGVTQKRELSERIKRSPLPVSAVFSAGTQIERYNSVVFVGDVLLARNVEFLMKKNGLSYPFNGINLKEFGITPAVVGNFEATIPVEHYPTPIGQIDFSVPVEAIPALDNAGFTHVSLANNHSLDFGDETLGNTQEVLAKQLQPFGHPKAKTIEYTEIISIDDYQVALIGINVFSKIDERDIQRTFKQLNIKSDFQIVYIHWGEEYALRHNKQQNVFAKKLVDFGADIIIGHHPHVVQGIDLIDGVPVFYSLGNYIFDQYFSRDVQEGLIVSISMNDKLDINLIPVTSQFTLSQPNLMKQESHAKFLQTISRKSHDSLKSSILEGTISLELNIATSDKVAMMQDINNYVQ